jgi:hypothetical protein
MKERKKKMRTREERNAIIANLSANLNADIKAVLEKHGVQNPRWAVDYTVRRLIWNTETAMQEEAYADAYNLGKAMVNNAALAMNSAPVLTAEMVNQYLLSTRQQVEFLKPFKEVDGFACWEFDDKATDSGIHKDYVGLLCYIILDRNFTRVRFTGSAYCTPMFENPFYNR